MRGEDASALEDVSPSRTSVVNSTSTDMPAARRPAELEVRRRRAPGARPSTGATARFVKKVNNAARFCSPVIDDQSTILSASFQTAHQSRKEIRTRSPVLFYGARRSADAMPFQNQSMITFAAGRAKMWPFIAGFGVVGYGVTVATLGITEERQEEVWLPQPRRAALSARPDRETRDEGSQGPRGRVRA